jgi:hypothetical protein
MKELLEYRASLINRLVEAAREFRAVFLSAEEALAPIEPGGWSIHQVAAHTRDVDKWAYGSRARRTAEEDQSDFQNFDGEAYMAEHYSPDEPLEAILNELVANVEELAELLRGLPSEAWSRESRHAMLGRGLTLQSWVEKDLSHIREHLEEIKTRKRR